MNGLLFAPSVCEVINLADEDEKWKIWDSNYDEEVAGMCDGTPNPLNFNIVESPLASDQSGAFFGMTYTGKNFILCKLFSQSDYWIFSNSHIRKPRTRTNIGHTCPLISVL